MKAVAEIAARVANLEDLGSRASCRMIVIETSRHVWLRSFNALCEIGATGWVDAYRAGECVGNK